MRTSGLVNQDNDEIVYDKNLGVPWEEPPNEEANTSHKRNRSQAVSEMDDQEEASIERPRSEEEETIDKSRTNSTADTTLEDRLNFPEGFPQVLPEEQKG